MKYRGKWTKWLRKQRFSLQCVERWKVLLSVSGPTGFLCVAVSPFQPQIQNYENLFTVLCWTWMIASILASSLIFIPLEQLSTFSPSLLADTEAPAKSSIQRHAVYCVSCVTLWSFFLQRLFGQLRVPDKNEKLVESLSHNLLASVLSFPLHRTNQFDCDNGIKHQIQSIFHIYSWVPAKNHKAIRNWRWQSHFLPG